MTEGWRVAETATQAGAETEALEPDLPICDPHHHLWDEREPAYPLDAFVADTRTGHNIVSSVYVEVQSHHRADGPRHLAPVGETEWVASLPAPGGLLGGIVAFADLRRGSAVGEVLAAHAEAGGARFRGIRHVVAWDPDPHFWRGYARDGDTLSLPQFEEGLVAVGRAGLTFETWCYFPQVPQLTALVERQPDVPVLLDHLGGPAGERSYAGRRAEVLETLKGHLRDLARHPSVHLKLGGIGMTVYGLGYETRPAPVTSAEMAADWGDFIRWCIDLFGPDRCMFESNYPVDGASCSYLVLWNAFKRIAAGYSASEKAALFHDTAMRFYGVPATS